MVRLRSVVFDRASFLEMAFFVVAFVVFFGLS
jgi:hypothetical protein